MFRGCGSEDRHWGISPSAELGRDDVNHRHHSSRGHLIQPLGDPRRIMPFDHGDR
jgi:hypothetical protein